MKFNVAKCHSMRVTRHHPYKHIRFVYTLHQQRLEQVESAKYIGITISDDLDWGQHISEISAKATKTLGLFRRNLAFAPRHTKGIVYKTLVRPKFEYAAPTEVCVLAYLCSASCKFLFRFRSLSGHLLGNSCSLG